jgi:sortase (surface protein transpeptidase)
MSTIERYLAQETKDLRSAVKEERHQKEEAQREKEEAQREKEHAQRKQEEERRQKEEALRNSVKGFLKFGATKQQIAKELNLPLKEVERIVYELGL